jgi:hypothetical protein
LVNRLMRLIKDLSKDADFGTMQTLATSFQPAE